MAKAEATVKARRKLMTVLASRLLIFLLLLMPQTSVAYYVGPEIGNSPSETRLVKTRGLNASSLAEAAYVPYVYSVGNNVVTFLRSVIPALQPKVDFFADQIQGSIDIANNKLMQTLENSNNGIIAAENFFTGLMKAFVFGKGPEDEERRRRFAVALIRSGMLNVTTLGTTTSTTTTLPTSTSEPTEKTPEMIVTQRQVRGATTTTSSTTVSPSNVEKKEAPMEEISSNDLNPMERGKGRDNDFNKMKVISIMKNML